MLLDIGYVGWFVDNIRKEKVTQAAISQNKAFKEYVESFQEGREIVAKKRRERELKEGKATEVTATPTTGQLSSKRLVAKYSPTAAAAAAKFKPTVPTQTRPRKTVAATCTTTTPSAPTATNATTTNDDDELLAIVQQIEDSGNLKNDYIAYISPKIIQVIRSDCRRKVFYIVVIEIVYSKINVKIDFAYMFIIKCNLLQFHDHKQSLKNQQ